MDLQVLSPNGGETFQQGDTVDIQWHITASDLVDISLYRAGELEELLFEGVESHSTTWIIPETLDPGEDYRIVVATGPTGAYSDISNSNFSIDLGDPSGIGGRLQEEPGLRIYPNPSTGMVHMEYPSQAREEAQIRIFDALGSEKEQLHLSATQTGKGYFSHDMSHYPAGIYIIQFMSGQRIESTLLRIH
jgi:hypothetical protein